jgi:hypothetical protein
MGPALLRGAVARCSSGAGGRCRRLADLAAEPRELGAGGIALAYEIRQLGAHGPGFGVGGRAGLVPDLRGLLFGGLQDALHAVGEAADHVGLVGRTRSGSRTRAGRPSRWAPLTAEAALGLHDRDRLASRQLQIRPHPGHHPLQPRHMLIDLPAVVAAEDDVEAWDTRPTHVGRHRWSFPSLLTPCISSSVGRSAQSSRDVHPHGAYRS